MKKLRMLFFAVAAVLMVAMPVFAQAAAEAGDNANSVSKYRALAAGVGFAIAVFGGALGQSRLRMPRRVIPVQPDVFKR